MDRHDITGDRYERFVLRTYAMHALISEGATKLKRPRRSLAAWLYENGELVGVAAPEVDHDKLEDGHGRIDRDTWASFKPMISELSKKVKPPPPSSLERRLTWVCETLSLPPLETDMLKASVRLALIRPVEKLAETFEGSGSRGEINALGLAVFTNYSRDTVRTALQPGRLLRVLGLLEDRAGGDFAPSKTILRIASLPTTDADRLRNILIGKCKKAELDWKDFAHLGEAAALAEDLLAAAFAKRAVGVNLLLYGEPGTGKTEFARTLAERLGAHAIFVGEADEENGEPTRKERIAAFAIAQSLAERAGRTILVLDEADDIFNGVDDSDADARVGSKVFMNRLVEGAQAPTIWITNHPDCLGPAVLRRMLVAVKFPKPGREVRRKLAQRIAARRKLKLSPAMIDDLADLNVSPAIIDGAARVAKLIGGRQDLAQVAARSVMQVLGGPSTPAAPKGAIAFDPVLSSADQDLVQLADRVSACGELAVSFCLHGLPGTGKSAFARYVAERMGLEVVEKRASDLLSMWVGGTEKQIAEAFQEAADRRAMLIIDEADSLLRDRTGARAAWEVSQVNEMLTWMERHRFPFACTTNLMDSFDPATLRRFLFKVRFLPMSPAQAVTAFRRAFGVEPPAEVRLLSPLTPGDFAVVSRKARLLGEQSPTIIAAMLTAEVAAKPGSARNKLGF